jgi:hypothetical protein
MQGRVSQLKKKSFIIDDNKKSFSFFYFASCTHGLEKGKQMKTFREAQIRRVKSI